MSSEKEITRRFSKKITVASLAAFFGLAGIGMLLGNPNTAAILEALGPWVLGLIITYMGIGYSDYRVAKGLPSFSDILTTLVVRRPHKRETKAED